VAFGAEENLFAPICTLADSIFFQFQSTADQRLGYIDQISFRKQVFGLFFLLDCLLEREIIVVSVGMEYIMFDAELHIWIKPHIPYLTSQW
jgi:hypothetical protein